MPKLFTPSAEKKQFNKQKASAFYVALLFRIYGCGKAQTCTLQRAPSTMTSFALYALSSGTRLWDGGSVSVNSADVGHRSVCSSHKSGTNSKENTRQSVSVRLYRSLEQHAAEQWPLPSQAMTKQKQNAIIYTVYTAHIQYAYRQSVKQCILVQVTPLCIAQINNSAQSCCWNAPLFVLSHWFSWPLCLAASGGEKHAHVLCDLICWERHRSCATRESSRTACCIPYTYIKYAFIRALLYLYGIMLHISNRFICFHWGFIYGVWISQTVTERCIAAVQKRVSVWPPSLQICK